MSRTTNTGKQQRQSAAPTTNATTEKAILTDLKAMKFQSRRKSFPSLMSTTRSLQNAFTKTLTHWAKPTI